MNKDLFVNGEKFISARRAAQEVGYAEDYVGQLCRDGKLPSRMVGRSWYVSRKAILAHKKGGSKKFTSAKVTLEQTSALGSKDLFFNGERFISSARAAKAVGYANDYIGQLCRSGALDCKMVGRSWYVSKKAILAHKKGGSKISTPRKKVSVATVRTPKSFENFTETVVAENIFTPEKETITYKKSAVVALPTLEKEVAVPKHWQFMSGAVVIFITAFVILTTGFSWLSYVSPTVADSVNIKVADASDATVNSLTATAVNAESFVSFLISGVEEKFAVIFGSKQAVQTGSQASSFSPNGIVAIPDNARHAEDVANIRNNFSDPVDVTFDQSGQSGVITPEFRDASETQNYTFVMVPVAKTK